MKSKRFQLTELESERTEEEALITTCGQSICHPPANLDKLANPWHVLEDACFNVHQEWWNICFMTTVLRIRSYVQVLTKTVTSKLVTNNYKRLPCKIVAFRRSRQLFQRLRDGHKAQVLKKLFFWIYERFFADLKGLKDVMLSTAITRNILKNSENKI